MIQVPPDSTGKQVGTATVSSPLPATVTGNERQLTVIASPTGGMGVAEVRNSQPASTEMGLVTREAPNGLLEAIVDFSSASDHNVIAAVAGQVITVWKLWLWSGGDQALSIRDGATPLAGTVGLAEGGAMILPKDSDPWFTCSVNTPFNLHTGAAVPLSGRVYYTQG